MFLIKTHCIFNQAEPKMPSKQCQILWLKCQEFYVIIVLLYQLIALVVHTIENVMV